MLTSVKKSHILRNLKCFDTIQCDLLNSLLYLLFSLFDTPLFHRFHFFFLQLQISQSTRIFHSTNVAPTMSSFIFILHSCKNFYILFNTQFFSEFSCGTLFICFIHCLHTTSGKIIVRWTIVFSRCTFLHNDLPFWSIHKYVGCAVEHIVLSHY